MCSYSIVLDIEFIYLLIYTNGPKVITICISFRHFLPHHALKRFESLVLGTMFQNKAKFSDLFAFLRACVLFLFDNLVYAARELEFH